MPILKSHAFRETLAAEVARTRRLGGFLTVGALGPAGPFRSGAAAVTDALAAALGQQLRAYDVGARIDENTLCLAMPGAGAQAAEQAGRRLLGIATAFTPGAHLALGIATAYGEIEGGAEAAIEAALLALAEAEPGELRVSALLRARPRLLVVDDDAVFARALAETLCERGWDADPCTDATEALALVAEPAYHGLFVDLVMPGHTGVEVVGKALQRSPKRPAILMSGQDAQHEAILDALALGPVMFVRKPISPADLDAALRMFSLLLPGLAASRGRG